jgi:hypothetical protein
MFGNEDLSLINSFSRFFHSFLMIFQVQRSKILACKKANAFNSIYLIVIEILLRLFQPSCLNIVKLITFGILLLISPTKNYSGHYISDFSDFESKARDFKCVSIKIVF